MITQESLKAMFYYDPDTGVFTWLTGNGYRMKKGDIAGWIGQNGHRYICVARKKFLASRLAFLYMIGELPTEIDHKNRDSLDNRWINLREVDRSKNMRNIAVRIDSATQIKGVNRCRNKYQARIRVNGERIFLGTVDTPHEAAALYAIASSFYHGEYGRTQ